jgi:hypothetical protein
VLNQGYYRSSFGSVRLWISRLSTDKGRSLAIHEPATGDEHVVQDRGQTLLRARATLLFDYMDGDELTPLDRLHEFKALVQTDELYVFTHPTEGSYNARVGSFTYELDEHGVITAECEFIAAMIVRSSIPAGAAAIPASGEGLVEMQADAYEAEFTEAELDSLGLGTAAKTTADVWVSSVDINPREVITTNGAFADKLSGQALTLENDLGAWQALKATYQLADAIRTAAETSTQDTASTFSYKTAGGASLRALLAAEYGADEVDLRYSQVMKLNDIEAPGLIPQGTELTLPAQRPRARNG